ncbi:MAG: carbohydrate kinase [Candidatus Kapabacteria bacterium]|nr:carbohydrate kinase [Candidatus Kapabacteria bacterium]
MNIAQAKIYCIGETVFDIIFDNFNPIAANAGGSAFNSAVSIARSGLSVCFISEIGHDMIGDHIINFFEENHVSSEFIYRFKDGQTPLAVALLDKNRNAKYQFYKNYPENRFLTKNPKFHACDYLLFGSYFALNRELRGKLIEILELARRAGTTIIYDPNFRKPHGKELPELLPFILENIEFADLVRGSADDFKLIFNTTEIIEIYQKCHEKPLIMTDEANDVQFINNGKILSVEQSSINVISTIGAGDSFNAGIIYYLVKENLNKFDFQELTEEKWKKIIKSGIRFAQNTCGSLENYVDKDFLVPKQELVNK